MESIFQDPCPTLNGTRRITMPQVLTRRREPITLLAKRGHLHLQTQKLALVAITQEAEAHSLLLSSVSLSLLVLTAQSHCSKNKFLSGLRLCRANQPQNVLIYLCHTAIEGRILPHHHFPARSVPWRNMSLDLELHRGALRACSDVRDWDWPDLFGGGTAAVQPRCHLQHTLRLNLIFLLTVGKVAVITDTIVLLFSFFLVGLRLRVWLRRRCQRSEGHRDNLRRPCRRWKTEMDWKCQYPWTLLDSSSQC